MIIPKEERSHSNKYYRKIYSVWNHMKQRCYNENATDYIYYGAIGVTTDDKWKTFDGFLEDVDLVDGWDEEEFRNSKLQLDKDLKFKGNKLYSKDTCKWVTKEENLSYIPSKMKSIIAKSPDNVRVQFYNTTHFADEYELNVNAIRDCLTYKITNHHGWQFRYEDEVKDNPFKRYDEIFPIVIALSPSNKLHWFKNPQACADRIVNGYAGNVSETLSNKNKHSKGWQLSYAIDYTEEKFVNPTSLRLTNILEVIATSPDGVIYEFVNRKAFCEYHSIDSRRVGECLTGKREDYKGWKFKYKE